MEPVLACCEAKQKGSATRVWEDIKGKLGEIPGFSVFFLAKGIPLEEISGNMEEHALRNSIFIKVDSLLFPDAEWGTFHRIAAIGFPRMPGLIEAVRIRRGVSPGPDSPPEVWASSLGLKYRDFSGLFLFATMSSGNIEDMLSGLSSAFHAIPVAGAILSSPRQAKNPIFFKAGLPSGDGVGIFFRKPIDFHVQVFQCHKPLTRPARITRKRGKEILELDGKPVRAFLEENADAIRDTGGLMLVEFLPFLGDHNTVTGITRTATPTGKGLKVMASEPLRLGQAIRICYIKEFCMEDFYKSNRFTGKGITVCFTPRRFEVNKVKENVVGVKAACVRCLWFTVVERLTLRVYPLCLSRAWRSPPPPSTPKPECTPYLVPIFSPSGPVLY